MVDYNISDDYVIIDKTHVNESIPDIKSFIYILQLEKDKYYVGFTERKDGERFKEHFTGNGSLWTKTYKPIQVIEWRKGTLEDEDRVTLEMMNKYGWWNVRGGKWCSLVMETPPIELYQSTIPSLVTIVSSFISHVINKPTYIQSSMHCYRCGRNNHLVKSCYAKTHINGKRL